MIDEKMYYWNTFLSEQRKCNKLLIDICNDYKPSIQINMFED